MIKLKHYTAVETINTDKSTITLFQLNDVYVIHRLSLRGNVSSVVNEYELIDTKKATRLPLNYATGIAILERLKNNMPFSDSFIFYKNINKLSNITNKHSSQEHKYTSTGIKFWKHQEQMWNYKNNNPNTVVSTHISPEGSCNLNCSYCSVTNRDTHSRIPLSTIKDYVTSLKEHGLRAVILTGGGEPTAYKHFNELVTWLFNEGLEIGLVTNGTKKIWEKINDDVCKMFKWIRVSINVYLNWQENIQIPVEKIDHDYTTIGCSMVYTIEHETINTIDTYALFKQVSEVATQNNAKYIRLLPNCLLTQENLIQQHRILDDILLSINDTRFFHQYKTHATPVEEICHQSYFKPYLSEEKHSKTGLPGTVYPCDSVVLNNSQQYYSKKYELCHAGDISEYLNKRICAQFNPVNDCKGCVHTSNVNMLGEWIRGNANRFNEFDADIKHQNFI